MQIVENHIYVISICKTVFIVKFGKGNRLRTVFIIIGGIVIDRRYEYIPRKFSHRTCFRHIQPYHTRGINSYRPVRIAGYRLRRLCYLGIRHGINLTFNIDLVTGSTFHLGKINLEQIITIVRCSDTLRLHKRITVIGVFLKICLNRPLNAISD